MKTKLLWTYLVIIHAAVLILVLLLSRAITLVRSDRKLPGSKLSASYMNIPDEKEWWHILNHDGRDCVTTVKELEHGVAEITVSPPGSSLVWFFYRQENQDWYVVTADFETIDRANNHLSSRAGVKGVVDGPPSGQLDGKPDANITLDGD